MKYFLIWIFFAASLLLLLKVLLLNFYPDFNVYYFATKDALHHINPYTKTYFTGFSYPPTVLPFLAPFTFLPFFVAEKVWTVISLLCLFGTLFLLFKIVIPEPDRESIKTMPGSPIRSGVTKGLSLIEKLCLSGLVFLLFPVKFTLGMGQINLIVLLFVVLGMYYYQKGKPRMSGLFFGVSLLLKLFPILFLLYFILEKKWKLLFYIGITFCLGVGLVALLFGKGIIVFFFQHGLGDVFFSLKTDYYNQALSGFLGRLPISRSLFNTLRTSITALVLLITFFAMWRFQRKTNHQSLITNNLLPFSLLLVTSLITNTFSWQHHFVWLIPAFIFVYSQLRQSNISSKKVILNSIQNLSSRSRNKFGMTGEWILFAFSYFLVASNLAMPHKFPLLLQSHVLYGTFILWGLIGYVLLMIEK